MPFVNGRFYINPAFGRALERARLRMDDAEDERRNAASAAEAADGHWITIDHRHVFIRETRSRIAIIARKYNGSTAWGYRKRKDDFGPNTNKCNKFVYDVTKEAGALALVIGSDGKPRPPLAGEWADSHVSIPGWRVLDPNESPQPGDVAAWPHRYSDATGHSGIVVSVGQAGDVTAMAAHTVLVAPDNSFNRSMHSKVTYRRYVGR